MSGGLLARCGVPTLLYLLCAASICGYLRLLLVPAVDWREVIVVILLVGSLGWALRTLRSLKFLMIRPNGAATAATT